MIDSTPVELDLMTFPLHGNRLIEASAGTGKTFTIAMLYVRLVLGHGGEGQRFPRSLMPPEVLVVTFTEAATQELRDRIRTRLAEAADYFRLEPGADTADRGEDDPLRRLRDDYPPETWPTCARKLQLAAEWMDEAAVSTIHAWCNRMLGEHAFDSGSLFTQTLEADQSELLAEAVRDYWRTFLVALPLDLAAMVRQWCVCPIGLQKLLLKLLPHVDQLPVDGNDDPFRFLRDARDSRQAALDALKQGWPAWACELEAVLDGAVANGQVNGRQIQARWYRPWFEAFREWAGDPAMEWPARLDRKSTAWTRLTPGGLRDAWKKGEPPAHPALEAVEELPGRLDALPDARSVFLCHAARWVSQRLAAEQARRAEMGFDDLLGHLDRALAGPNGERLAGLIRQQFPVALIDEFQDTDPVQYRIFDAIYRRGGDSGQTALVLIGDPKQAIYAFRGADIHTYLKARQDCGDQLYTLKKNFRSTGAMVKAVNRCFLLAETRLEGQGAFLFRQGVENPVPFIEAAAGGRQETWVDGDGELPALTAWLLPAADDDKGSMNKDTYLSKAAEVCATEMVRLLNQGSKGLAGFRGPDGLKPLRPADMAVLVKSRREADGIRRALSRRGVRSVYLSDRDSVYQGDACTEVQYWLAACAEPDDGRHLRAALATRTLGLGWAELERLGRDENAWEERVLQFRGYRECWRRQGVLPMLRRLLHDFEVPARLLRAGSGAGNGVASGERILTDVLQLAELLQQASSLLEGEHALIRYLAEQRLDMSSQGAGDPRQIRLESDADLVQVITIHKSKGLEYPLVFLPFICNTRPVKRSELPLKWHDSDHELKLSLEADEVAWQKADEERLGEELRQLYVALTRARFATWLGMAPLAELEKSAIGYLLAGGRALGNDGNIKAWFQPLAGQDSPIAIQAGPPGKEDAFAAKSADTKPGVARTSGRVARQSWWVASYSAIAAPSPDPAPLASATPFEDNLRESRVPVPEPALVDTVHSDAMPARAGVLHDLPSGAVTGTFLHEILEWAAREGFGALAAEPERLRAEVTRRCEARDWSAWQAHLSETLLHLLGIPLELPGAVGERGNDVTLSQLDSVLAEMEFWMPVHALNAQEIDRLVCTHTLDGAGRPAIHPRQLNGMLKGFMDLVFEHAGRYYVADYKSNRLGRDDTAYTREALRRAVLEERYELQYVLYVLALHRHLRQRIPGYDYDQHMGGAVYIFLRGLCGPAGGVHAERPPRALIEGLDALFAGQSAPLEAA